jgi:hypothetical protein
VTFIDSALLNLTEACCQRFQLFTGRTNVWVAVQLTNLSIVVYFVWAGVYFLSSDVVTRVVLAVFCGGLLYLLTQTVFKVSIEAAESSAYRRVAKGYRNPRRIRDAMLRVLFLILSFLLLGPVLLVYATLHLPIALLSYSLIVLTTVLLYVVACDPLPPCAGKIAEWLGSFAARDRLAAADTIPNTDRKRTPHSAEAADRNGARLKSPLRKTIVCPGDKWLPMRHAIVSTVLARRDPCCRVSSLPRSSSPSCRTGC